MLDFPRKKFYFPFPGWQSEFGVYQWFYIKGYQHILEKSPIKFVSKIVNYIDNIFGKQEIEEWKREMPLGDWEQLSAPQIYRVLNGRPIRFDKACLVILVLEEAIKQQKIELDIYEYIKISPAFFVVDVLYFGGWTSPDGRKLALAAAEAIGQPLKFIDGLARNNSPMTYMTAEKLAQFLVRSGYESTEVRMLRDRSDKGRVRFKTPNPDEIVV